MAGAAEKINHFSGAAKTNLPQTLSRIQKLVHPTDIRAQLVTYPLLAAALILLPQLPKVLFMACNCGGGMDKKSPRNSQNGYTNFTAGQTSETIAFTEQEYQTGRITREKKIELDNLAIRNNALAALNGIETKADEMPDEWNQYK